MAEESNPMNPPQTQPQTQGPPQGAPQQMQVTLDDSEMKSVYVNFFRVTGNPDEVLLDLGMYSQVVAPGGAEPIELTHRLIMNFVTAKKLAEVLRVVVARHEQAFGVIEVDPQRRLRVQPQQQRPQG